MAAPKTASIRKRLGSSPWFLSSDVELPFTALKSVTPGTYQWSDQAERKRLPEALLASSLLSWYLHQPGSQQLKRCVRVVKVQSFADTNYMLCKSRFWKKKKNIFGSQGGIVCTASPPIRSVDENIFTCELLPAIASTKFSNYLLLFLITQCDSHCLTYSAPSFSWFGRIIAW